MKKYFLLLILSLFAINSSFAQETWDPTHLISKYSEKFIGTWKYESEGYSISITFTKGSKGGLEILVGTYQVQMNGQRYEDLSGETIVGIPTPQFNSNNHSYNPNEIFFDFFDYKYFKGANKFSTSQFILTMQEGYTDRAVLTRISEEDPRAGLHRKRFRPTGNLLPPDGSVLIKQPNPQ